MSTIIPKQWPHASIQSPQFHQDYIPQLPKQPQKQYLNTNFDKTFGVLWMTFAASCPNKIIPDLLTDLRNEQINIEAQVRQDLSNGKKDRLRYQVLSSEIPGVFNLGGDLQYISELVKTRDRDALIQFGQKCIGLVYNNATNYRLPVTTISLIQGTALGGGLEAALSSNVVIAERGTKMGFPEAIFSMFPGMGAYQLLLRRLTPIEAERVIQSGRSYTAEEFYEMNVIDILAEKNRGEEAVWDYVKRHSKQANGEWGLRRIIHATSPIKYEELRESIEIWADTALQLSKTDLKHMELIMRGQKHKGL
jgi:DSF synthase